MKIQIKEQEIQEEKMMLKYFKYMESIKYDERNGEMESNMKKGKETWKQKFWKIIKTS